MMFEQAPILTVKDLYMTFPNGNGGLKTIENVSFSMLPQEFICLLGPSGSGKSTLLRILAGLLEPTSGSYQFASVGETGKLPKIGMAFQKPNLMPWRTVIENITLPLELQNVPEETARDKAMALIEKIGLQGFEDTWPGDLSGGMAQRVSLARALIQDPDVLLLDEPFGALDALTREQMGNELLRLWQSDRKTVIMVTHNISEALLLSDRVLVFTPRPARIQLDLEIDLPRPRYEELRYSPRFSELSRCMRESIGGYEDSTCEPMMVEFT
jgi:NitT/TauT family transport system ATP-binding protein